MKAYNKHTLFVKKGELTDNNLPTDESLTSDYDNISNNKSIISKNISNTNKNFNFIDTSSISKKNGYINLNYDEPSNSAYYVKDNKDKSNQINPNFNTFNQSINEDELLKLKREEFAREINEKSEKIDILKNKLISKNSKLKAQENRIQALNTKVKEFNNLKQDIHNLECKIEIKQNENWYLLEENKKLIEQLNNKNIINQEYLNLTKISVNKFDQFEEINNNLKVENNILKKEINNIKNKLISLYNKDIVSNNTNIHNVEFDIDLEMIKIQEYFKKQTENEISNLIDKYDKSASYTKELNDKDISEFKEDISKLNSIISEIKKENCKLNQTIEENNNKYKDFEFDLKLKLDDKTKENERLISSMNKIQQEVKEIENEYKVKLGDNLNKIKGLEEKLRKTLTDNEIKDKRILENNTNNLSLETDIKKRDANIRELENRVADIELNRKSLYDDLSDCKKGLENKNIEIKITNENYEKQENILLNKLEESKHHYNIMYEENEILKSSIEETHLKINELNSLIHNKYQPLEIELLKEKGNREEKESAYESLEKQFKIMEEKFNQKISKFKKDFNAISDEYEKVKFKQEQKINKLTIKIEELMYNKAELVDEVSNLKEHINQNEKYDAFIEDKQRFYNNIFTDNDCYYDSNYKNNHKNNFVNQSVCYTKNNSPFKQNNLNNNDLNYSYSYNKMNFNAKDNIFSPLVHINTNNNDLYSDKENLSTMNNLKDVLRKIDSKYNVNTTD